MVVHINSLPGPGIFSCFDLSEIPSLDQMEEKQTGVPKVVGWSPMSSTHFFSQSLNLLEKKHR